MWFRTCFSYFPVIIGTLILLYSFPTRADLPTRIVGGFPAVITDYPYQASLRYNGRSICGCSIINSNYVVTAAHCIISESKDAFSIKAGATNIQETSATEQIRSAKNIIIHPEYSKTTPRNDIAIIELSSSLEFNNAVNKIELPDKGIKIFAKTNLKISGWGTTKEQGQSSPILRAAVVPAVSVAQCRRMYSGLILNSMICAGGAGKDTCQGDSGGPLALTNGGKTSLIGITSFGAGCGRINYPGVYTRVASFIDWINKNTK